MKHFVRIVNCPSSVAHVIKQPNVHINGSRHNGANVRWIAVKVYKQEMLFVENLIKEKLNWLKMNRNVKQPKSQKIQRNVIPIKNVKVNGLMVHGVIVAKNAVVVREHVKFFALPMEMQ